MPAVAIQLQPVESSRIKAIGYDEDTLTAYVQFTPTRQFPDGVIYGYADVTYEDFYDFQNAESKGTWFRDHLLNNPAHPAVDNPGEAATDPAAAGQAFSTEDEALATALVVAQQAAIIVVASDEAYLSAAAELVTLNDAISQRVEFFRPMKEAAFAAHRAVCAKEAEALKPLMDEKTRLTAGMKSFTAQREAERRRLQRESDERVRLARLEAQRAENERARECAEAAPGQEAEAPAPITAPLTPAPVIGTTVPQAPGVSVIRKWAFVIEDEAQVPCTPEFWSVDPAKIKSYVERMKGHAVGRIPGVRVYEDEQIKATGRRGRQK